MLRLHPFRYHRPATVDEAVALLDEHGPDAMPIAGGTDLMPNMKHRLFTPGHVVSLNGIAAMRGIGFVDGEAGVDDAGDVDSPGDMDGAGDVDGPGAVQRPGGRNGSGAGSSRWLRIGALETLATLSRDPVVRRRFPGLADAAGLVAGPQLRNMGTIGGNVCLDTRCTYYNQTEFWRRALGYCLKKDGDTCHVTKVGKKCVAAHSADTPPNLIALGAKLVLVGPEGARRIDAADFFLPDGIWNTRRAPNEVLVEVLVPVPPESGPSRRSAYRKLRQRKSIDFPLLSVAVVGDFNESGAVARIAGVVSALGARPRMLSGWTELAAGRRLDARLVARLAERAWEQCRPLENTIVEAEWRRAMVRVYVKRALEGVAEG